MSDTPTTDYIAEKPDWAKSKADLRRERGEKPSRVGRIIWLILLLLAVGFAAAALLKPKATQETEATALTPVTVSTKYLAAQETQVVQAQTVRQNIKVTGTIQPLFEAQLPALISAQIEQVAVRPGDAVKKGQLLIAMDTENLNIQKEQQLSSVEATQAQLALAQSQLKRTQEMSAQGIATSAQLEQALSTVQAQAANLHAQQSQIKATEYQIRNANVYAPINGIVSFRQAEPGQFVGIGSPLLTIVDLARMELRVNVSAADSANIVTGMKVNISIEGLPLATFTGTVSRISPVATNGTRTIPVYIVLENTGGLLRGGMFATGQITLEEKPNTLVIPPSAIRYDEQNQPYVLKIDGETVVRQDISVAGSWGQNQMREVTQGLNSGDRIVVLPLPGLQVNDTVQLIEG
ncbi:MAG: efflux RND transporter periplasmic adaptor subunit [Reinekea sp.]|nr:efflux RND transporter periplasmic adaptor subunit [Reinekea sp.]